MEKWHASQKRTVPGKNTCANSRVVEDFNVFSVRSQMCLLCMKRRRAYVR